MNQSINTDSKNSKEPQQKYRLGTVSIKILGGLKPVLQAPNLALSLEVLEDHGRHSMLSFLSPLPISVLCILDTEANKFYDRNHQLYDAALLTRCYTQHALRPFIDSEKITNGIS